MHDFSEESYLRALVEVMPDLLLPYIIHDLRKKLGNIIDAVRILQGEWSTTLSDEQKNGLINVIGANADVIRNILNATAKYDEIQRKPNQD